MFVNYQKDFQKQFKRLPKSLHSKIAERINILVTNPTHSQLHNHKLEGKWKGYSSINITGDIRAIYKIEGATAVFVAIGSHSELYE